MRFINKIRTRLEAYGEEESRNTFYGELNYESGKVFYLLFLIMVILLPYIPGDIIMHQNPVYIISIKIGLTILCIFLIALRYTKRFRYKPGLLMMIVVGYLHVGSVVIMITAGDAMGSYISSFTLLIVIPMFLPLPLKFKFILTVGSLLIFILFGILFDMDYSDSVTRNFIFDFIAASIVSLIVSSSLNKLRYSAWKQRKMLVSSINEVTQRDVLLNTMNHVAAILLKSNSEQFDEDLHTCLGMMAETIDVDRVYVWQNHVINEEIYATQIYEWSKNAEPQQGSEYTTDIPLSEVAPGWADILACGESVNMIVDEMLAETREHLRAQGIKSILVVPIISQNEFWGAIGFDDCHRERHFSMNEESVLRSGSLLISNALMRNETEKNIQTTSLELEAALLQAQKADKSKSDFLAMISHEIRTPLNVILGISQFQSQDENLNINIADAFAKVTSSGTHLLGIINDLLDISKIETGNLELQPSVYCLPSLINDLVQLNIMCITSKSIKFELELDENLPLKLYGDGLKLKQILNNLLSNAAKYTDKGRIKLAITYDKTSYTGTKEVLLRFDVSDTGQGIMPEDKERLFSDYARFNISANRNTEGVGLGLTITKKLSEMMGGSVEVESEYGIGSVFSVSIPQEVAGDLSIGTTIADKLRNFTFRDKKYLDDEKIDYVNTHGSVLIVDDMESNMYVAEMVLEPYGLHIEKAISGFESIEKIKNGSVYDIIFMDHMMPEMDGIETVIKLREFGYKGIIIALTANVIVGNNEMFMQNGFDGAISKPIDLIELDLILNKFIRNSK